MTLCWVLVHVNFSIRRLNAASSREREIRAHASSTVPVKRTRRSLPLRSAGSVFTEAA